MFVCKPCYLVSWRNSSVVLQGFRYIKCNINAIIFIDTSLFKELLYYIVFVDEINLYKASLAVGRSGTWLP